MREWQLRPAEDLGLGAGERLRSIRRETGLVGAAGRFLWWAAARGILRAGCSLTVRGRENLPARPPFVMISNHASHLDSPVLAAALPLGWCDRTFALAAGDTFFMSDATAALATGMLNALPIWRGRTRPEHMELLRRRLVERESVFILFPEGTRSRDGALASFKSGLGRLVAGTAVPVLPCHIEGAHGVLPPGRSLPRRGAISLTIGKPLAFADTGNDREGWRRVTEEAERAVRDLAEGTTGPAS